MMKDYSQNEVDDYLETDYETERGKPLPSLDHSLIQARLSQLLLNNYGKQYSFPSELDLELAPKGATPDLCVYPKMKRDPQVDEPVIKMKEPPIAVVEIISPKQALDDITEKARLRYFPNGVKTVWIVIPSFKAIVLVVPGLNTTYFNKGEFYDPATNIKLSIEEVFDI
ncbi:MAG: Uma2 family endonuclease [Saprospiraceae bacterium]|nr:Uma2 family endonuclease [Saprospiraceae bacterium]